MDLTDIYIEPFIPKSEIHILLKCTWNIFKAKPHDRTQKKPQQNQENLNQTKRFLRPQGPETRNQPHGKKLKHTQIHGDWIACY